MNDFNEIFESVKWDSRFSWFEALLVLADKSEIIFYVKSEGEEEKRPLFESVVFFSKLTDHFEYIVSLIVEKFYPVYKDSWETKNRVSAEFFTNQVSLDVVTYYSDDEKNLTFEVGDLFGGHVVVVDIGSALEVEKVVLES